MATAVQTTDHDEIQKWAEERGGRPAKVSGTAGDEGEGGVLRIDFGEPNEELEEIEWDEFFEIFDERGLKFLYSPEPNNRFNKLVYE